MEPEQRLSRASKFLDPVEDQLSSDSLVGQRNAAVLGV